MNTAIAAIEEDINGAAPRNVVSFGRGKDGREP